MHRPGEASRGVGRRLHRDVTGPRGRQSMGCEETTEKSLMRMIMMMMMDGMSNVRSEKAPVGVGLRAASGHQLKVDGERKRHKVQRWDAVGERRSGLPARRCSLPFASYSS